jgi:peptidyl-prolyl cis-trans isomerase C/foldase protein PrsA
LVPEAATASPTPYTLEGYETRFQETITEFKSYGISEETLRKVYEIELIRNKLKDDMARELSRTDTQVLLRHILVPNELAAQTIIDRLNRGEDFAKLAAQFSTDPGSKDTGGVYDWAPASNYVPEFRDASLTQEIGVVGQPVKTDFGYHIIQVIGREELSITDSQFEQKKQTTFDEWVTTARESADIQTFDIWKERVPTEPVLQ